jgi:xylulokinase
MRALRLTVKQVRASGGGARSPLWRQMMADIFNSEIITVNATEGAAYGAALLAGVGSGIYRTVEEACRRAIAVTGSTRPGGSVARYDAFFERYRALYRALEKEFDAVAHLTS